MSLKINHNIDAMKAQRQLTINDAHMSKTLANLSSGVKINSAADGPAALVISENMRAQIAGINQAIDNNESAVSMVQTAEGALTEVNRLLIDIRQRAIHASNEGINDAEQLAADQAEVENALAAIDRIAQNTQFGRKKLIDGSNVSTGSTLGTGIEFSAASANTKNSGKEGFAVNVNQLATKASFTGNLTQEQVDEGVTLNLIEGGKAASFTSSVGDTVKGTIEALQAAAIRNGLAINIQNTVEQGADSGSFIVEHSDYGAANSFQARGSGAGIFSEKANEEIKVNNGRDVSGTINGESAIGKGELLMGRKLNQTTSGLVVKVNSDSGLEVDTTNGTEVGKVIINQNALQFQVGANEGQTVAITLLNANSTQLGRDVDNNSGYNSLADIDLSNFQGAQDAITLVDKAINELSANRGRLGAFQKNTLESNLSSLRISAENLTASESVIRDADIASEMSKFTKTQILSQTATAMLAQANNAPKNVIRLLANN